MVVDSLAGLLAQDFIIPAKDGPGSRECHICAADHWYESKMQRLRKELNLDPDARYFNNGVLMVNLKLWRSQATGRQALKMAFESNGSFRAHDQDIANILFQHSWVRIHARYNMFGEMFCGKAGGCAPGELAEALERPAIIHFTGASKPWNYLNDHPYKKIYWHYRSMTPWKRSLPEDFSIKSMIWKHMPPMARSLVARRH
jgi:lipopolysaccharide biosynthesis glycosyltransferase